MRPVLLLCCLVALFPITACKNASPLQYSPEKLRAAIQTMAVYSKDSTEQYLIAFLPDKKFIYTLLEKDAAGHLQPCSYEGYVDQLRDTLFLFYKNDVVPPGLTNYVVMEATGNYLIQYFTDTRKRVFMEYTNHRLMR